MKFALYYYRLNESERQGMEIEQSLLKFSVIIPVYNAANYISDCLESLINQDYSNLEIIIVDDGSSDQSAEICRKYGQHDERIHLICESNKGVSNARNVGIQHATGDYILFSDADDQYHDDVFRMVNHELLNDNLTVDIVIGSMDICTNLTSKSIIPKFSGVSKQYVGEELVELKRWIVERDEKRFHDIPKEFSIGTPWGKFIKRELIDEVRFNTNLNFSEDLIFINDIVKSATNILVTKKIFYKYFVREGSVAHRRINKTIIANNVVLSSELRRIEKDFDDSYRHMITRKRFICMWDSVIKGIVFDDENFLHKLTLIKRVAYDDEYYSVWGNMKLSEFPKFRFKLLLWCFKKRIYFLIFLMAIITGKRKIK